MLVSVVSSQSSQLGSYFSIDYLLKNNPCPLFGLNIILFCRFPTRSSSAKDLYVDYHHLRQTYNVTCLDFFVDSIWSKCVFACIYILCSALSYLFDSLILIEPRPFWACQVLSSSPLYRRLPLFRHVFLSGDGFMALTLASSPPWLSLSPSLEKRLNERYMERIKGGLYLYCTSRDTIPSSKFIKLDSIRAASLLKIYCDHSYPSTLRKLYGSIKDSRSNLPPERTFHNVIVFPMTTFSETGRCLLDGEINMYVNFLVNLFLDHRYSDYALLIKPHPGQSPKKSDLLLSKLQSLPNFKIHPLSFSSQSLLGSIPLEILVMHLLNAGCNQIALISASTSAVPISLLFKDLIDYLPAFGLQFLDNLLSTKNLNTRLNQEQLIQSLLALN